MTAIAFSTVIGPVAISCVVSEQHTSDIEISENPIETGAKITDHAYILPKKVMLDIANDNAAGSYDALKTFQESRVPFTLVTGLSVYTNMLVRSIEATRDKDFSTVLRAKVQLQEVILVETAYVPAEDGSSSSFTNPNGSKAPSPAKAGDAATADRVTGTVQSGDASATTVPADQGSTLMNRMFGS